MTDYNIIVPHYSVMLADSLQKIIQDQYPFKNEINMELLSSAMNDLYRVRSGSYSYILRIPRAVRFWPFHQEQYEFEMAFVSFLRSKDISVSYPIPTSNKKYLGILNAPEGIRYYSLHTNPEGSVLDTSNSSEMILAGKQLARIHQVAREFNSTKKAMNWDLGLLVDYGINRLEQVIPETYAKDFHFIKKEAKRLSSEFKSLLPDRSGSIWGIIHGEYRPQNVRIHDGQTQVMNFEYCGHGYYVFDLVYLLHRTDISNINNKTYRAFLEGYQQVRSLSDAELEALPVLAKLALISRMTVSTGMIDLVGMLWFEDKLSKDLKILKKVLQ